MDEDHFYFGKSGLRKGKPTARCKLCINWNKLAEKNGDHGTVPCSKMRVFVVELMNRCGGLPQAAKYSQISRNTLNNVLGDDQCSIHKVTAKKILIALDEKRREDRRNGIMSREAAAAIKRAAQRDRDLERMTGY